MGGEGDEEMREDYFFKVFSSILPRLIIILRKCDDIYFRMRQGRDTEQEA